MNIVFITRHFEPEIFPERYLINNLVYDTAQNGFEVTILTGYPIRGIDNEIQSINYKKNEEILAKTLRIIRIRYFADSIKSNFLFFRALQHISFSWNIYLQAKKLSVDAYFIMSTPPFMGITGAFLSRKAPTVYNLQDVFPDSLITAKNLREDNLLIRLFRKVEKWIYKKNTHIITITRDFKKLLLERGVPQEKISTVYNWIDENEVLPIERKNNYLVEKFKIDSTKFLVTYCGNIGYSQNLEMVVDIAKELEQEKIQIIFIGDGGWKKNIEQYIAAKKTNNVMMIPFQPYEDIAYVMSLGDASLVCSKANVGNSSFPSKTWSIMSAGRAVICSFDKSSELCEIINNAQAGLCSDAGDKKSLKNNILKLYADSKLSEELGRNGRKYIEENLTRKQATKKYFDILCSVVNKAKGETQNREHK